MNHYRNCIQCIIENKEFEMTKSDRTRSNELATLNTHLYQIILTFQKTVLIVWTDHLFQAKRFFRLILCWSNCPDFDEHSNCSHFVCLLYMETVHCVCLNLTTKNRYEYYVKCITENQEIDLKKLV